MSTSVVPGRPAPGHAVCLDLRAEAYDPADRYAPEEAVRRALAVPQPPDERRFLVVDDADRLVAHQLLHERLSSYGPARVVCLAVGAPGERTLRRTRTPWPPDGGVLWLLDGFRGPDAAALRPLVDVLATPEVFDAVLRALARVAGGVAVPAARVVEHDLSDEARARAWRQAVEALTGPDVPVAGTVGTVPGELSLLLDESVPRSLSAHDWLPAQGRAGAEERACRDALDDALDGYERVRGPAGLLTRAGRGLDLPGDIERAAFALRRFRATVADAFALAGGSRPTVEERGLLAERGVHLPEMPREISRTGIVPALRDHTHGLIDSGLPLRSVAARLAALSTRTAPAGSAARLAALDAVCGPDRLDRLTAQEPFRAGGPRSVAAAVTGVLALLAGVWPGLGWGLGPAVGLLAAVLALLMLRRRPNRSPDGRLDGGGATGSAPRLFGGLIGGVAGAVLGQALDPPVWAAATALAVSVAAVVLLALRDWTHGVDDWWQRADPEDADRALREVRHLLVTAAVHDWLFADVRHHCSDGAGAVARLLRALAATADAYQGPGVPGAYEGPGTSPEPEGYGRGAWDWDDWTDGGGQAPGRASNQAPAPGPGGGAGRAEAAGWSDPVDWSDRAWSDAVSDAWTDRAAPADAGWSDAVPDPRPAAAPPEPPAPPEPVRPEPVREPERGSVRETDPDPDPDSGPAAAPRWLERRYGDGGPALVDTLHGDLSDGVAGLLRGCWAGIERDPGNAARLSLDKPMTALLDETRSRLERDAAASPPPGRERGDRPDAARLTGVAPDGVARLLAADDDPGLTVPLCGPEHLRLLSHEPGAVRRVRFVPETMRRGTTGDDIWRGTTEDVVWTDAGRHAGVLRLVPLRADVVHTVLAEEDGAP
ncbi:hypothetical protein KV205_33295 [Streptomyces sp. SKN60]|uniref:hypothetical protein n=1 Tax=Streptomyces sp. SKN60 TaxID=2855506 RepID=UPI00224594BF|nr:hypothetical protein [Streptomyces sp. SKN60]MCX2185348.1 hypothetical protein [Streptomyces sp. SKN60]